MHIYDKIKELSGQVLPYMIETRRFLHQHPEVSYKEYETTRFIKEELDKLNIEVVSPLETGCVGILKGAKESERVVALRADIDALEMEEEGEAKKDFLSRNKGAAHCCGHDAHTANLLGVARILSELKSEIEGRVLLIFQPGEERLPGGGRLLCETGILNELNVQQIFGLHTSPNHAPGTVATRNGALMGSADEFEIEIIGQGGHAAKPHEAVDPIVIASQFITMAQSIVSRNVNPTDAVVITVGRIEAGTAHNIIPEKVKIWGTARTLSHQNRKLVRNNLERLLKGVTEGTGASYTYSFANGYPAVINTDSHAQKVLNTTKSLFGENAAEEMDQPIMAGEDFAFYLEKYPGAFFFVGSGSEESGSTYTWHHPKYNVDDRFFETAAPLMASLIFS